MLTSNKLKEGYQKRESLNKQKPKFLLMDKFKQAIVALLKKRVKQEISLETPPDPKLGDYAFPCFSLAKIEKRNPFEIAKSLAAELKPSLLIKEIKAVGPYVNFFINKEKLIEATLKEIVQKKDRYGSNNSGKNKKALIEHTSINPNASPHMGRARNAIIGDSLTKLLKFEGYKTKAHYFINDVGKQIAILVYGARNKKKVQFDDLLKVYIDTNKKLKKNPELEQKIFDLLNKLEKGDKKTKSEFKRITQVCVKGQTGILSELGIGFDVFDSESKYLWSKDLPNILKKLEKTGRLSTDESGRKILDQKEFNFAMKSPVLVLTRGDGTSLYPLRDIAYTIEKIKKAPDRNILVLGEDQKLYFQQLKAALSLLKYKAPESVHYSFVLLGRESMSTRSGKIVLLEELMEEIVEKAKKEIKKRNPKISKTALEKLAKTIGYGAIKYGIIKISPDKEVLFNLKQALSFEGDTAPYCQYAHTRISAILKKYSKKVNINANVGLLNTSEEYKLIKLLSDFPIIIDSSLKNLKPSIIANYVYELSKAFNEFYHTCPVLPAETELKEARVLLISCVQQVLKNGLNLIGIEAPEQM